MIIVNTSLSPAAVTTATAIPIATTIGQNPPDGTCEASRRLRLPGIFGASMGDRAPGKGGREGERREREREGRERRGERARREERRETKVRERGG